MILCKPRHSSLTVLWMVGCAAVIILNTGCRQADSSEKPLTPVRIDVVQAIPATGANTYSANIQPYQQVELAFKSNGYLASIRQVKDATGKVRNIDQGDWVTKGTVLATVSQDDYKDKLQQANAQLARSQANYDRAKLSFDRMSVLYKNGAATVSDYDNANAQMLDTKAAIDSAKASVSEAQIALAYCELRAPFDGWIVKRNVDEGQLVGPGDERFHHLGCALCQGSFWRTRHGDGAHQAGQSRDSHDRRGLRRFRRTCDVDFPFG